MYRVNTTVTQLMGWTINLDYWGRRANVNAGCRRVAV